MECDGHDFHERTKEQAQRDKARDRDLQMAGWQIARFTGAEIARSPQKVADKVYEFIHEIVGRAAVKRRLEREEGEQDPQT